MTPKEKCVELIEKYSIRARVAECSGSLISMGIIQKRSAIQCAIICVEEILNLPISFMKEDEDIEVYGKESTYAFWQEVLTELKKMQ